MQLRAMEVPEGGSTDTFILVKIHVRDQLPLPAAHVDFLRHHCYLLQSSLQAPGNQDAGGIWQTLDSRANLGYFRCRLEDVHGVACEED